MALRLRIERRRPPLPRFFSSSAPDDNDNENDKDKDKDKDKDPQPSSISSHFSDIMATLKHRPSGDHPFRRPAPHPSFLSRPQQQSSPEYMARLQERLFQFRSSVQPLPSPSSDPSFMKVYQQNDGTDPSRNAAKISVEGIKESLKGMKNRVNASGRGSGGLGTSGGDRMSLSRFTDSLRLRPVEGDKWAPGKGVDGGVGKEDALPLGIFGKEIMEKKEGRTGKQIENLDKTRFTKSYAYEELGEKLRMLRSPADGGTKCFSLEELNERLIRLKEMEKEMEKAMSKSKNLSFGALRDVLVSIQLSEAEKTKNNTCKWAFFLPGRPGHCLAVVHSPCYHVDSLLVVRLPLMENAIIP